MEQYPRLESSEIGQMSELVVVEMKESWG